MSLRHLSRYRIFVSELYIQRSQIPLYEPKREKFFLRIVPQNIIFYYTYLFLFLTNKFHLIRILNFKKRKIYLINIISLYVIILVLYREYLYVSCCLKCKIAFQKLTRLRHKILTLSFFVYYIIAINIINLHFIREI